MHNAQLLNNELLLANEERGIINAVIRWTGSDGNKWAVDFFYMISLDEDDRCVSYKEWKVVGSRQQKPALMESYFFQFERPAVVCYFEHIEC